MDTPIVNGTAYPYLEVEPKAYRFRVLSAANDRFFNLQLYVAADKTTWIPPPAPADVPGTPTAALRRDSCRPPTAPKSRWSRSARLRRTSMRTGRAAFPIRRRQGRTGS